ncbi:hemicentin-2 [Oryzias melastigma]|uniref:hemicentin-2 n=1 Tax=Oryzias melastigma TaxID=30732 RepID=UPI00168D9AE6|nr:hemicentin-2 [Oryzias melastigma]
MKIVVFWGLVMTTLPAAAEVSFGRVDQRVTLECGISTNPTILEWFYNEERVLRVDRKGLINRAQSNIAQRSNTRGSTLEISNLKKEDAGKFTCRADGESEEQWLYLVSVVVTPSGVLQEGSDASLQCEVHSLDQRTTVKWQRPDGSIINDKTVDLKPVKTSHGGTWTCEVTAAGGESFTTSLTFTVKPKVSFGRVDQRVTVECGISTNPTDLEWFHNEKRVLRVDRKGFTSKAQSNIARRSNTRGSNLEINNLKKEDAGKFTCRANGKSGERWLYPVSVVVTPSGVLQEGSDASLQCEVHSLDQRTTVKWQRPDGFFTNNKTVDLKPVKTSHGGTWTCEVTAAGGESFTTSLTITVKRTTLLLNYEDNICKFTKCVSIVSKSTFFSASTPTTTKSFMNPTTTEMLTAMPAVAKVFFGRVDQRVTLECGISTNPTILEWFHNEERVLRVDRKGLITKVKSNIAQRSNTRGSNLEINNLKKEDAGKFTCRADGKSEEHWLYLVSVVVTPSGVLQEGSDASLQCEVHSLDQRTTVKWQRPDGFFTNNKTVDLKPVKTSHGGTWMCEVTAEGGESFTTSLTITVKPSAPTTTKSSMNPTTKEMLTALPAATKISFGRVDQRVTLECGISTNPTILEWFYNEEKVLRVDRKWLITKVQSNIARRSNTRGSTLEIYNLKKEDAGKFTCRADGKSEEHWLYLVSVVVTPSGVLQEGSDASLQCEVHSLDQRTTVKWQRPDGSLFHDKTVDLKPVQTSHGGTWTCGVTAEGGESFTTSLIITVKPSAPTTTKSSMNPTTKEMLNTLPAVAKVFFGRVDQRVTLECGISTNPTNLEWLHNEERFLRVDRKGLINRAQSNIARRSNTRGSNLEINNLKKEDAGKFTCRANWEREEHWLYLVSVVVTPSGVLQEGSDASLQCEVHSLDQRTTVKWHRPDGSLFYDKTVDFKPLKTSHGGTWMCEVTAEGGESFTTSLTITVKPSGPTTTKSSMNPTTKEIRLQSCAPLPLGLHWWIWVALGASYLVLSVLIISVVLMYQRVRRRKKIQSQNGRSTQRVEYSLEQLSGLMNQATNPGWC